MRWIGGYGSVMPRHVGSQWKTGLAGKPMVSPATNARVYFLSRASRDHPVWRSHREEAQSGSPSGRRIPRTREPGGRGSSRM